MLELLRQNVEQNTPIASTLPPEDDKTETAEALAETLSNLRRWLCVSDIQVAESGSLCSELGLSVGKL